MACTFIRSRDCFATGGDIYKLSKILGHSSVAVTEAHYAHLLKEDLEKWPRQLFVESDRVLEALDFFLKRATRRNATLGPN